jgi:hypothetical protein
LSLDGLKRFLCEQVAEISRFLHGDVGIARQILTKYVDQLTLTPQKIPESSVLAISGDVELNVLDGAGELCSSNSGHERPRSVLHAAAEGGVVVMVARDSVGQHYTPFSIPIRGLTLDWTV